MGHIEVPHPSSHVLMSPSIASHGDAISAEIGRAREFAIADFDSRYLGRKVDQLACRIELSRFDIERNRGARHEAVVRAIHQIAEQLYKYVNIIEQPVAHTGDTVGIIVSLGVERRQDIEFKQEYLCEFPPDRREFPPDRRAVGVDWGGGKDVFTEVAETIKALPKRSPIEMAFDELAQVAE